MKPRNSILPFLLFLTSAILPAHAQDATLQADPAELPRIPATEPADAPATFELRPGFALELAAAEPLVVDPVDIEFDEHGRLFVVEMRGYSERREEALGRIKLLIDDDDDGIFDRATIYARDLKWPTSVCCYDGGIFVAASPDICYFKDNDGDGVSDEKETVFTGFGLGVDRLNMQALLNSLTWGPDNRIWGATARNGGKVRRPGQPENQALDLRGADFSFDPETRELRPENGTAQFGLSFDSAGRRYVCSNSNHIQWVGWERDQVLPNPFYKMPAPLVSIAADGAAAPVFRISPDEPWRIVRTRWRVAGVVKGPVEGGGRVSGYFTAATGITIYTGDAYGPEYRESAFIGDAGSNLVHHKILRRDGDTTQPVATRIDGESGTEFLRSTDNWFRPVNFANGPDGALYICDMYREVIEHPWSLPEGIKEHLDLNSGNDRGRIWRVVPAGFQRPPFSLERTSGWQTTTNRRLAYESGTPAEPIRPLFAYPLNALTTPTEMANHWSNDHSLDERAALAEMIGRTGDLNAIDLVLGSIAAAGPTPEGESLLSALVAGFGDIGNTAISEGISTQLDAFFAGARSIAANSAAPDADRARALRLLAFHDHPGSTTLARALLSDPDAPESVRTAAIAALGFGEDTGPFLLEHWSTYSTETKSAALTALTLDADRARFLLDGIQSGVVPPGEIPLNTGTMLRSHRNKTIAKRASELLPPPGIIDRQSIVKRYSPALTLAGDPARGATVYKTAACLTCHRSPAGEGFAVGPDLATFKTAGPDSIIKNLFDPNAEVAPQYQAYIFTLAGGESLIGIIAREDSTDVTLRMAGGIERSFPRKEVQTMQGLHQSLMPEGLEEALSVQDAADLLAYILGEN